MNSDFKTNPHWVFAAHEIAAVIDPDMATKMTVQFRVIKFHLRIEFHLFHPLHVFHPRMDFLTLV